MIPKFWALQTALNFKPMQNSVTKRESRYCCQTHFANIRFLFQYVSNFKRFRFDPAYSLLLLLPSVIVEFINIYVSVKQHKCPDIGWSWTNETGADSKIYNFGAINVCDIGGNSGTGWMDK